MSPVKIYFSGAISGGRENASVYQQVVTHLQSLGHEVLSAHVADPEVLEREKDVPARVVHDRDLAWIDACDAVVAEVSTPSLGVGYEYGYAVQIGKPVLCIYRHGLRMTKMILGNPAPNLTVATYQTEAELDKKMDAFLRSMGLMSDDKHFFTQTVHAGDEAEPPTGRPISPPIYPAATYTYGNMNDLSAVLHGERPGYVYSRYGSPTVAALEAAVAALEAAEGAIAFSSGMAALHCVLMQAGITPDRPLVAAHDLYGSTHALLTNIFATYDPRPVHYVDMTDLAAVKSAIDRFSPQVVFLEVMSNPLLKIADLPQIAAWAHAIAATVIADSTFATPYLIRPLEHGADVVVHSATKYLGGHGDVMAGVVATDARRAKELRELIKLYGSNSGPFEAWIVLRGLKTLAVRMRQHCSNAMQVAHWLSDQPMISKVMYPGLPHHSNHAVARRLFRQNSFGGIVSFELRSASEPEVFRFMEALKLIRTAPSLGDVGSLVLYPAQSSHYSIGPAERHRQGISEGLVRLSVGIEDADDILADLQQALAEIGR